MILKNHSQASDLPHEFAFPVSCLRSSVVLYPKACELRGAKKEPGRFWFQGLWSLVYRPSSNLPPLPYPIPFLVIVES